MKKFFSFPILIILIIGIVLGVFPFIWPCNDFFKYNLLDAINGVIITCGIYYFATINDEKNSKASKIDQIIDVFRKRLTLLFSKPIDVENNREEYLHSFKYLDNKFALLKHMTDSFDCDSEISTIKDNLNKIETYITDNINENNEYFQSKDRKEKIPNLIDTIEVQLDNITIKLF